MDVPSPVAGVIASIARQEGRAGRRRHADRDGTRRGGRRGTGRSGCTCTAPAGTGRAAATATPAALPAAVAQGADAPAPPGALDLVVLGAGPGRLYGRLPRRRPRAQGHAHRALADARRRLPERRLHSVEGAAACRQGHRGGRRHGRRAASSSARRTSIATGCAPGRTAWSRKLTGGLSALAKQRKVEVVRGDGEVHRAAFLEVRDAEGASAHAISSNASSPRDPSRCACPGCRTIRASSIRPARSSCRADCKRLLVDRRRHHRSGDGLRLRCARHSGQRGRT